MRLGPLDLGIDVVAQADAVGVERIVARCTLVEDRERGEQKNLGIGVLLFQCIIAVVHASQHRIELRCVVAVGLGIVAERADFCTSLREVVARRPKQIDVVRLIALAAAIDGILHAPLIRQIAVARSIDAMSEQRELQQLLPIELAAVRLLDIAERSAKDAKTLPEVGRKGVVNVRAFFTWIIIRLNLRLMAGSQQGKTTEQYYQYVSHL